MGPIEREVSTVGDILNNIATWNQRHKRRLAYIIVFLLGKLFCFQRKMMSVE